MKTIAFNKSRGTWLTTALVLGGLVGLYVYRRQGGKYMTLLSGAFGAVKSLSGKFATAENDAEEFVGGALHGRADTKTTTSRTREIATAPEDMDRLPAT